MVGKNDQEHVSKSDDDGQHVVGVVAAPARVVRLVRRDSERLDDNAVGEKQKGTGVAVVDLGKLNESVHANWFYRL